MKNKHLAILARICADLTGDGHLQIKDWRYLTSFYSNNYYQIEEIAERFRKVYGVSGKVYLDFRGNLKYKFFIISKEVATSLASLGVPIGRKTDTEFSVPRWIRKGSKQMMRNYLIGIFSCEGCVYSTKQSTNKRRWRIGLELYKRIDLEKIGLKYMSQIRTMLLKFNIQTSPIRNGNKHIRKDGTKAVGIKFEIEGKEFEKFYKRIGFDDRGKTAKLTEAIAEMRSGRRAEVS